MNRIEWLGSEIRELSNEEARQIKGGGSPRNFFECLTHILYGGLFGGACFMLGASVIPTSPMNVLSERS